MGEPAPFFYALLPALNWPLVLLLCVGAAVVLLGSHDRRQRQLDMSGSGKRVPRQLRNELWYKRYTRRQAAQRKEEKSKGARAAASKPRQRFTDRATLEKALSHPLRVVIDCSYATVHTLQERRSLATQLVNAWAYHRRCARPVSLWVAGSAWDSHWWPKGMQSWVINRHDGDAADLVASGRTVYLSPDGDKELGSVEDGSTYIIGGLVDRSLAKGLSKSRADQLGVESCYLPLERAVGKQANPALNVDTVFRVLHRAYADGDVVAALRAEVPKRRRGQQNSAVSQSSEIILPRTREELDEWPGHRVLEYSPKTRLLNILRRLAHCASQPEPAPVYVFADLHDAKRAAEARGGELAREEAVNAHGPWRSTLPCRSWGYYCRCTVDASSVIGPLDVDEATGGFGAIRGGLVSSEAWGSQRRKSEHRAALQCLCLLLLASSDVVQRAAAETSVPAKLAPVQ